MTTIKIEERIDSIKNYIHDCERRISQGEIVDLVGLDQNMEEICNEVIELPIEEGRVLQKKLAGLVAALDKLVNIIRQSHQQDNNG